MPPSRRMSRRNSRRETPASTSDGRRPPSARVFHGTDRRVRWCVLTDFERVTVRTAVDTLTTLGSQSAHGLTLWDRGRIACAVALDTAAHAAVVRLCVVSTVPTALLVTTGMDLPDREPRPRACASNGTSIRFKAVRFRSPLLESLLAAGSMGSPGIELGRKSPDCASIELPNFAYISLIRFRVFRGADGVEVPSARAWLPCRRTDR